MNDTATGVTQKIVSFTSEGSYRSVVTAVNRVSEDLAVYLAQAKSNGENPVVVSVSQSSGFIGHIGIYASITAVINI
jgi:hypothetical protein